MNKKIRKYLTPLSKIYEGITYVRNKMYDKGVLPSEDFQIPIINVGNLRVGGTGKTPMVAYLASLLSKDFQVAILSRGYKRKSSGFLLADEKNACATSLGDEPYLLYRRFPNIYLSVDEDRVHGIKKLMKLTKQPEVILLDDAFQHRRVNAGLNILLTPYHDLYVDDQMLPAGNLRENRKGAKRAQLIVVTKSPNDLTEEQEFEVAQKLEVGLDQTIFFSGIKYASLLKSSKECIDLRDLKNYQVLLLTGIANPKPLVDFLKSHQFDFKHLSYPDHHNFSESDIKQLQASFDKLEGKKKLILTTEKDYVRIFALLENIFYLSIDSYFINHQKDFDQIIKTYVEKHSRNR